jgi:hypothetical protein
MSTLTISLDDESSRLVQEAARAANQPVSEWARNRICRAAVQTVHNSTPLRRIAPLHPGAIQTTTDFNAPLEEFEAHI